ncbi:MAG: right-handed parallel beta-helix repeat-containing protein [Nanoarchaeota archaeon]|nr:right-handed parallel beta-helix repeat-containing protein [Nanoarchaeota archaeon]
MVKEFGKGGIFLIALVLLLLGGIFFKITGNVTYIPTTVSNNTVYCSVLNTSGSYSFTQDVLNENYTSSPCFNIIASDVILDCAGYTLENSSQSGNAVYAEYVNNITVKNCDIKISSDSGFAISFKGVNDSFIINNDLISNKKGVYLLDSRNLQISDNTFDSNGFGIILNNSVDQVLNNNTFTSNEVAIQLVKSSSNTISNSTLIGCSSSAGCLILEGSDSNLISLGNISSSSTAVQIISLEGVNSSNNLFRDLVISGSSDVNVGSSNNLNNSFVNTSYDSSKEFVYSGSEIIRKWYYRVFVNSTISSSGISDANVTLYNSSNFVAVYALTGSNGYISLQSLLSYRNNGNRTHLGVYSVVASNVSSSVNHSINLTANLLNDYLSFNIAASVSNSSNSSSDDDEDEPAAEPASEPAVEPSATPGESSDESIASSTSQIMTPLIYLEQSQIEGGYTAELDAGNTIYFNVSGEFHSLTVDNFDRTSENKMVTLTVTSEPQTFSLAVGEQKKLDLNSDSYYDVVIGFENISFDDVPLILIMKINEAVIKEPVVTEQVTTNAEDNSVTFGFIGSIENKINSPIIGPVTPLHIIIGVLIICILLAIYVYISHRKHNLASKH